MILSFRKKNVARSFSFSDKIDCIYNRASPTAPDANTAANVKTLEAGSKGTQNLKTDLMEELGETVVIREGDQSRRVSKQRAMVKTLIARTLKGDARASNLVMSIMMRLIDTGEGAPGISEPLHDDELEILSVFEDRVRRRGVETPAGPPISGGAPEEES